METNQMNIERIVINEPYSAKEKGRVMNCTISLAGVYGSIELKLANEDIEPIIPILATAMANAGKAAAASLQGWLDEVSSSQPVIEHVQANTHVIGESNPDVLATEGGA